MMPKTDLSGQRFGRLTAIKDSGKRNRSDILWICDCDCGKKHLALSQDLRRGHTKSCGCLRQETATQNGRDNTKHGGWKTLLYFIWGGMKERCLNSKNLAFKYYGGRGIKICEEWLNNYPAFKTWALVNGYKENLTIDRINNDKGYFPENCRWVTRAENNRNKRGRQ